MTMTQDLVFRFKCNKCLRTKVVECDADKTPPPIPRDWIVIEETTEHICEKCKN